MCPCLQVTREMEQSPAHWQRCSFTPVTTFMRFLFIYFCVCDREQWERGKLNVQYATLSLVRRLGVGVSSEASEM